MLRSFAVDIFVNAFDIIANICCVKQTHEKVAPLILFIAFYNDGLHLMFFMSRSKQFVAECILFL